MRFERTAARSQSECSTKLSYIPLSYSRPDLNRRSSDYESDALTSLATRARLPRLDSNQ